MSYPSEMRVKDARSIYYSENRIPTDGGASEKIAKAQFGPIVLYVPNFTARMAALQRHDLNHIVLDQPTTLAGEAVVGAFETGAGCGKFWVSWFLEPQNIIFGFFLCPRASYRSFLVGRRSQSLFHGPFQERWLDMTVGELRGRFLYQNEPVANLSDKFAFIGWAAVGFVELMISLSVLVAPFIAVFWAIKSIV